MYLITSCKIQHKKSRPPYVALLALALALISTSVSAKLYKWVDENGKVFYSDKIPPKASKGAHSTLNEKGITVDRRGAAKSDEEIEKERELEALRKQKEAVIKKQEAKDKVLLKTFRSEDDLILARDGKIRSVDNYVEITKGNIKRFKAKLAIMQSQAADLEKSGKAISNKFLEDMEAIKRQINQSYASIVAREQTKLEIRTSYDNDIKRFRVLRKLKASNELETLAKKEAELNTVYRCIDIISCDDAWGKAIDYVQQYASTKLQLLGDNIYMTSAPTVDKDVSLTVARIKNKKTQEEKIFLDQQCRSSVFGQEFCESEFSREIKRNFVPFLTSEPQPVDLNDPIAVDEKLPL